MVVQKKPVFQTSIKLMYISKLNNVQDEFELNLNGIWVRAFLGPIHLGLRTGPYAPCSVLNFRSPVPLENYQMAHILFS